MMEMKLMRIINAHESMTYYAAFSDYLLINVMSIFVCLSVHVMRERRDMVLPLYDLVGRITDACPRPQQHSLSIV